MVSVERLISMFSGVESISCAAARSGKESMASSRRGATRAWRMSNASYDERVDARRPHEEVIGEPERDGQHEKRQKRAQLLATQFLADAGAVLGAGHAAHHQQ